jgi:hypothetical protein
MSGCNCKKDVKTQGEITNDESNVKIGETIGNYVLKAVAFLLLVVLLPLINIAIIWFMFNTVVLSKEVNISPLLLSIGSKFQPLEKESDYEDIEGLDESDVVMLDAEDITYISN